MDMGHLMLDAHPNLSALATIFFRKNPSQMVRCLFLAEGLDSSANQASRAGSSRIKFRSFNLLKFELALDDQASNYCNLKFDFEESSTRFKPSEISKNPIKFLRTDDDFTMNLSVVKPILSSGVQRYICPEIANISRTPGDKNSFELQVFDLEEDCFKSFRLLVHPDNNSSKTLNPVFESKMV